MKLKTLVALGLLVLTDCGSHSQPLWCFIGMHRDFRCHQSLEACQVDWHREWDRDIAMNIQHPLLCEEW